MSLTPHSPSEAALDQGQAFFENSIRKGTIFIPGREYLLYFIAIDLGLNGGHRLGHRMSKRHIFLRVSVQVSGMVVVFKTETLRGKGGVGLNIA